jgi:hypothetical protein
VQSVSGMRLFCLFFSCGYQMPLSTIRDIIIIIIMPINKISNLNISHIAHTNTGRKTRTTQCQRCKSINKSLQFSPHPHLLSPTIFSLQP